MAGYELDIRVLGGPEVEARLREMGNRAILTEPALLKILDVFRESERALFSRGRSWAPNAGPTIARKGRNDPLVMTGALEKSLTEAGDPNQLVEMNPDYLKFGSKLWYAHFAIGTKHQPARTVVKLRPTDRAQTIAILREWILHGEEGLAL